MSASHRWIVASLMLCLAVVLAGCTDTGGAEVATARSTTVAPERSNASTAPPTEDSDYDKALRYTRCMTAHGQLMDDPVVGKPLLLMQANSSGGGTWAKVPEAFDQCKSLLPATWPVKVDPKDMARERPFGECMRQHGIDYPEPDANGMVRYPADPTTLGRPEYQAAEAACRHLIDDPANDVAGR